MNSLKYAMGRELRITVSGEQGVVIGRAEYAYAAPSYLLRYRNKDGSAVEQWWSEHAVEPA